MSVVADMNVSPACAEFYLGFGMERDAGIGAAGLAVPVLAGEACETLFAGLKAGVGAAGYALYESPDWLVGWRSEPLAADIGTQTERMYADMLGLARARGRELVRIWNYVPAINAQSAEGLETYRVFCRGRALAFEREGWTGPLPAASAVGGAAGRLAVMFAAAREKPIARENPEQVPAFEYPEDYGPKSPSFSRAMQVTSGGRRWTFVSGTAAIKGHVSMATGDLAGQIDCTLDNLRLISAACGLGEVLQSREDAAGRASRGGASLAGPGFASEAPTFRNGAQREAERHFKVYLRHAADLAAARAVLEGEGGLLRAEDRVTWLLADICRADLLIEIEATVVE